MLASKRKSAVQLQSADMKDNDSNGCWMLDSSTERHLLTASVAVSPHCYEIAAKMTQISPHATTLRSNESSQTTARQKLCVELSAKVKWGGGGQQKGGEKKLPKIR